MKEDQFHHVICRVTEQLVILWAETQCLRICCFHGNNKTVYVSCYEIDFFLCSFVYLFILQLWGVMLKVVSFLFVYFVCSVLTVNFLWHFVITGWSKSSLWCSGGQLQSSFCNSQEGPVSTPVHLDATWQPIHLVELLTWSWKSPNILNLLLHDGPHRTCAIVSLNSMPL